MLLLLLDLFNLVVGGISLRVANCIIGLAGHKYVKYVRIRKKMCVRWIGENKFA